MRLVLLVAEIPVGQMARTESRGRNIVPGQSYPAPEAEHEVVCTDVMRFLETLEKLQRHLGIAEKVPKVGGRELHLHTLYCQVTSLGGCEQVIARKQWRVGPLKGFPPLDCATCPCVCHLLACAHHLHDPAMRCNATHTIPSC